MSSTTDNSTEDVSKKDSGVVEDGSTKDLSSPTTQESSSSSPESSNNQPDKQEKDKQEEKPQLNLLEVPVSDEHAALNIIVGFLGIAQRRGAFAMNESAKIFECVKMFQNNKSS